MSGSAGAGLGTVAPGAADEALAPGGAAESVAAAGWAGGAGGTDVAGPIGAPGWRTAPPPAIGSGPARRVTSVGGSGRSRAARASAEPARSRAANRPSPSRCERPSRRAAAGWRRPSRAPPRARAVRSRPAAGRCRAARAAARGPAGAATGRCTGSSWRRSWTPRIGARSRRPAAGRRAQRGQERLVRRRAGDTRRRSGRPARSSDPSGDEPGRVWVTRTRRRPGRPRRAAPRRRPARPGRASTSTGSRSGPTTTRGRRVEVARRAVRLDALDVERSSCRRGRRSVASMPSVSSPGNVQLTSWLKNRVKPGQASQSLRPAAGRVRRPRDGAAEAVLPLGQERVVARRHEHGLGGGLGGRAVVAAELRQAARRGRAGSATRRSGSGRTAPRRSAGRRPAGSP